MILPWQLGPEGPFLMKDFLANLMLRSLRAHRWLSLEFIGEMGHFNHEPRSATVQAISEVELIAIPNGSLDNVIFARPSWAKALVKTLSQRLKKANKALTG